jgi:glucose-1-phosphate thymidylyltransferase
MEAIIPAAGFATRLYPLTLEKPKALIEVGGKKMIERTIDKLAREAEVDKVHIISNRKFLRHFHEWAFEFEKKNPKISVSVYDNGVIESKDALGAVGDIQNFLANKHPKDFIVAAPDNLFDFDISKMKKTFEESGKSVIAIKKMESYETIKRCSCVLLDESNRIIFFEEKPQFPASKLLATAIWMLNKEDIRKVKFHNFEGKSNMGHIIEMLIKQGEVKGAVFDDEWSDIGTIEQLKEAEAKWLQ